MILAPAPRVLSAISFAAGLAVGALATAREHRGRRTTERLGAAALEALLEAIDANDADTGAHVRRVALYATIIAEAGGIPAAGRRALERVALFHDIGKIQGALFDILHDDSGLTPAERKALALHPEQGARVLSPLRAFYPELAAGVLAHHERWDGGGYPHGLRGTRIPLAARIVAIADAFDVVTHGRPYRGGRPVEEAARMIGAGGGRQFDPALAALVLEPRVLERLRQAVRGYVAASRGPGRIDRRTGDPQEAPDITFRWRSGAGARPARARPR